MPPTSEQDEQPLRDADASNRVAADTLHLVLAAEWVAPSIARDHVRRWLGAHLWSPAQTDELVLAISEAVSNSIEHGYGVLPGETDALVERPSAIQLDGRITTDGEARRAEFTVTDRGRWRPPAADKGSRGHGMTIMRACADEFRIDTDGAGTTIFLRSRPVPPRL